MIQILNKYGATNSDDGLIVILDKNGNVKKIESTTPIVTHEVLIDCGSFLSIFLTVTLKKLKVLLLL